MKKILSIAAAIALMTSVSFASTKNADSGNGYTVTSQANGSTITKAFNKKGNWVYTIERFTSDNLPKNIMDAVQKAYGSYFITGIEKVEQPGDATVFVVHAQDCNTLKTFRVVNDEAELVQDFEQGK